jgi:hypothetical protein
LEQNFAIVEVGHFVSEVAFMPAWAEQVARLLKDRRQEVQVRVAASEAAPFQIW